MEEENLMQWSNISLVYQCYVPTSQILGKNGSNDVRGTDEMVLIIHMTNSRDVR